MSKKISNNCIEMILKPITTESSLYRLTEQGYDMIFVKDENYQFEVI